MRQNVGITPQHQEHSHVRAFDRFVHRFLGPPRDGRRGAAVAFIRKAIERQGSEAFADFETGLLEHAFAFCRAAVGDYIEARDEGPIDREGQVFYRAAPTRKTINTVFGPVTRSRYRTRNSSIIPVDESLIDGYLTVPAAYRALMDHAERRGQALRKTGGHEPVVEPPSPGDGGQSLEGERRGEPG